MNSRLALKNNISGINPASPDLDTEGWIRQEEADRGERSDRPTSEERELVRQLRRENEELKRINEILRLA